MRSRCQDECEADVKISNLKFVQSAQDNAKSMSSRMRSRCQDNAKPMSKRIWEFYRVKVGWVSRIVGVIAKPMSRTYAANATIMRSQCQDECEVDINTIAKPMSKRQSQANSSEGKNYTANWIAERANTPQQTELLKKQKHYSKLKRQDNAKPMSRRMQSRCQDECEADVKRMRSRCQGEC